uniref:Large ribosomal subunit protein eL30 n=1 Tax=Ditylenchus dipsaci TaxID=166011 RepID=A0A915ECW1_9BILA
MSKGNRINIELESDYRLFIFDIRLQTSVVLSSILRSRVKRRMAVKKQKNSTENINSRLALVMKSGKVCLGYKSSLKSIRNERTKLVILSNNVPPLWKSEVQYYAMLGQIGVHEYQGNNIELEQLPASSFGSP